MYAETCPDCLGVGTITHRRMLSRYMETVNCKKCKGEKVVHHKVSPQRREYRKKYYAQRRVVIPVRWTPPEKIPKEYEL
jgi:DnaJ-class molecular chaperone